MDDNEIIVSELDKILDNFKEALDLMHTDKKMENKNIEFKTRAQNIVEGSKRIDDLLTKSELFDQNDNELDIDLEQLDQQNTEIQNKFKFTQSSLSKYFKTLI